MSGETAGRLRVVTVNGSPSDPSKTMGLVDLILQTLAQMTPLDSAQIDVYRLGPGFTAAAERHDVTPDVESALRTAETAELLIAATPVFRGSYTGMFKHFFDLVDQYALANKPVILVATGGSERHALVLEHALRPLFGFFQALTVPVGFYASAGDFDGTLPLNPEIYSRVKVGLQDVIDILRARAAAARGQREFRPAPP